MPAQQWCCRDRCVLFLGRKIRSLSRSRYWQARYDVRILVPIIIVMLLVQLFDNGFAIRLVAERFFVATGLVFGLNYLRQSENWDAVESGSLGTTRGYVPLDR